MVVTMSYLFQVEYDEVFVSIFVHNWTAAEMDIAQRQVLKTECMYVCMYVLCTVTKYILCMCLHMESGWCTASFLQCASFFNSLKSLIKLPNIQTYIHNIIVHKSILASNCQYTTAFIHTYVRYLRVRCFVVVSCFQSHSSSQSYFPVASTPTAREWIASC